MNLKSNDIQAPEKQNQTHAGLAEDDAIALEKKLARLRDAMQAQSYPKLGLVFESIWHKERWLTIFALAGGCVLLGLILPYRSIHIPSSVMFAGSLLLMLMCLRFSLENITLMLIMFTVYAPFQKILAGDFQSFIRAFNITNIFLIFMLYGWVSQSFLHGRKNLLTLRPFDLALLAFMAIAALSLVRGSFGDLITKREPMIYPLKRFLEPMMFYFIFVNNLHTKREIRLIANTFMMTNFLVVIYVLKEAYIDVGVLSSGFSSLDKMRIEGIADHPNQMAAYFCYYGFYPLAYFIMNPIREIPMFAYFAMSYEGMRLTFSRGGQVGFLMGFLATLAFGTRKFFAFVVVPLLILFWFEPDLIPKRFVGRMGNVVRTESLDFKENLDEQLDTTSAARIRVWTAGARIIQSNYLVGVGFNRFKHVVGDYDGGIAGKDAHNEYLKIASEMGLPALLLILGIIGLGFVYALEVYRTTDDPFFKCLALGYLGGVGGLLGANMFGSRLESNELTLYYWILTAVMIRLSEIIRAEKEGEHVEPPHPSSIKVPDFRSIHS